MMSNNKNKTFDLMIKQLEMDDIGCDYTCACGFSQYTRKLDLYHLNFTYPPNLQIEDVSFQETGVLHIDLIIGRVYPAPNCSIICTTKVDERVENITKLDKELLPDGMMYKVIIRESIKTDCLQHIYISCQVWSEDYEVKSWQINGLCPDNSHEFTENNLYAIVVPLVIVIIIIVYIFFVCWNRKSGSSKNNFKVKYHSRPVSEQH